MRVILGSALVIAVMLASGWTTAYGDEIGMDSRGEAVSIGNPAPDSRGIVIVLPQRPVERLIGWEEGELLPRAWFVGRLHPMLVHLPVGLLLGLLALELAGILHRRADYRPATLLLCGLTAATSLAAAGAGFLLSLGQEYPQDTLARHTWLGLGLAVLSWVMWRIKSRHVREGGLGLGTLYGMVLLAAAAVMVVGAYQGMALTHGRGYLTRHFPEEWRWSDPGETRVAEAVSPADIDAALATLADQGVTVVPIAQSEPGLAVNFSVASEPVTDASLATLEALRPEVALLNLAGTSISDLGLERLADMPALARLHLERTDITDAGLEAVGRIGALNYLNLHSTSITDAGLRRLYRLDRLRRLFLWQTAVTPEGIAQLQAALPELEIVGGTEVVGGTEIEGGEGSEPTSEAVGRADDPAE